MGWVRALAPLASELGKALDRLLPDKKKLTEGQLELNKLELQEAPRSYLRLWRSFLFWVLSLCFLYVVIAQPLLTFYFPGLPLPVVSEELSDTIIRLLLVGLGAGY